MIPLTTQEQFNELLSGYGDRRFLVWFSAAWCGPCQRMDKAALMAAAKEMSLPFYYCDEVVNSVTATACGISSYPTFVIYGSQSEVAKRMTSDTTKVCQWIRKYALS